MQRTLIIRYLVLIFAPMMVVAGVGIVSPSYLAWAGAFMGITFVANTALSIYAGATLHRNFSLCLRKDEPVIFWTIVGGQFGLALFAVLTLLWFTHR